MIIRLLTLANAGNYPGKREWFYPLKNQLLRRLGTFDGHDKQVIQKACWRCDGTGQYVAPCAKCRYEGSCGNCYWMQNDDDYEDYLARKENRCPKCGGSGWWRNATFWLERWRYRGVVFHIPVDATKLPLLMPDPVVVYTDYVKHAPVYGQRARRAALALLWIFAPWTAMGIAADGFRRRLRSVRDAAYWKWRAFMYDEEIPF